MSTLRKFGYKRGRAYHREIKNKTIKRKKYICEKYYGFSWYKIDGYYAKGKIHCSCPMCRFQGKTHSDAKKEISMQQKEKEYQYNIK